MNKESLLFLLRALLLIILFMGADYAISSILKHGLDKFYGLNSNNDILIIGASQIMLGIDKSMLESETGMKVAKYTREGVNITDRENMVYHYYSTCKKKPSLILFSVDKYLFTNAGLSSNSYKLFFPFMEDNYMNSYIEERTSKEDYIIHKIFRCTRYSSILINGAIRGLNNDWRNYKTGTTLNNSSLKTKTRKIDSSSQNINTFERILSYLQEQQVKVILINIPYINEINSAEPEKTERINQYFKDIHHKFENVEYWDFSSAISMHREWYYDINHLNVEGQKKATELIINCIKNDSIKN